MTGLRRPRQLALSFRLPWTLLSILTLLVLGLSGRAHGMIDDTVAQLRQDTRNLFYHGYDNYLAYAFPEDELRPISCKPQTRNAENPRDVGLNDVLGNYSLTLIDSLSTLGILASSEEQDGRDALREFKEGVQAIVQLYGNGHDGQCGSRACGFDLDSKVQVFETNIRGVGGLLSAHLFAIGELPIRGYGPAEKRKNDGGGIEWDGFVYDGQLLRLARDLASRLLPAFSTITDLPYPRVNLRHGIPFYQDAEGGVCRLDGTSSDPREITETCGAGAGSLVLEFTTLSRLTGDARFEKLAKNAFWAVWARRSSIDLIGGGIDAESGQWISPPLSGIGAGIDSFFEYAMKSHILLSSSDGQMESEDFLRTWQQAHAAIKRHISRPDKFPFYGQSDLSTGAPRYSWVDNLSAYYPGLLTLAGELDEAIESHLLFSALWTRYSALPERWHVHNSFIDPNFKHWAGRPEFIESTYYLYQATRDPYYLHVGEMTLRDIRRRCWTKCGWADLGDVITGEQRDRMESFFLGETAKYLFLLFEDNHPLNHFDKAWVFTTEGHPLIIPPPIQRPAQATKTVQPPKKDNTVRKNSMAPTCPVPPALLPLSLSNIVNRPNYFHAAAFVELHRVPVNTAQTSALLDASDNSPGISLADIRSPTNYTFYPWTLSHDLIPANGFSRKLSGPSMSTLSFPNFAPKDSKDDIAAFAAGKGAVPLGALRKVLEGVVINSLSNVKLNMIQESKTTIQLDGQTVDLDSEYRVLGIANLALGKDEKVLLSAEALSDINMGDPNFRRVKDLEVADLIIDLSTTAEGDESERAQYDEPDNATTLSLWADLEALVSSLLGVDNSGAPSGMHKHTSAAESSRMRRYTAPAMLPTGIGAALLSPSMELSDNTKINIETLTFKRSSILFLDSTFCEAKLGARSVTSFNVLIIMRGGCSFNDKLANIPSFAPSDGSLKLVIVMSTPDAQGEEEREEGTGDILIRPLLDQIQKTPTGLVRREPLPLIMIDGTDENVEMLRAVAGHAGHVEEDGTIVVNAKKDLRLGDTRVLGIKRRYWFESMGVVIANLGML